MVVVPVPDFQDPGIVQFEFCKIRFRTLLRDFIPRDPYRINRCLKAFGARPVCIRVLSLQWPAISGLQKHHSPHQYTVTQRPKAQGAIKGNSSRILRSSSTFTEKLRRPTPEFGRHQPTFFDVLGGNLPQRLPA